MILTVRGGTQIEARSGFALVDTVRWGYGGLRNITSVPVTDETSKGIPALHRAARIRAEALAGLRLKCWRGDGPMRLEDKRIWQARLFRERPNEDQTRFQFWETVGESLAWRNNAFLWKNVDPVTGIVVEWYALHPDQVKCEGADGYTVTVTGDYPDPVGQGPAVYKNLSDDVILHVVGHGAAGKYEAPSPIQVFRDAIAGPVARQRHEAKMWRKGATVQFGVEFPPDISVQQAKEWQADFKQNYTGTEGDTVPAIGGGAQFKPIGMNAADAQFVQMANLTVADASLIMGVPVNLLIPAASGEKTPNLEQELQMFLRFGLGTDLDRIESALGEDETLFGGSLAYPAFDSDQFVRGDLSTESAILVSEVQAGITLVDEARAQRGLPPLPNGQGQIPQITPVGGAPNQNPAPPAPAPADDTSDT